MASATGTPEPDGLTPAHVRDILAAIPAECKVTGADLVEVAPWVSRSKASEVEEDLTLDTAGEIASVLLKLLNT